MATAKKGTKSSKTAHVLNLLTGPGGEKEKCKIGRASCRERV